MQIKFLANFQEAIPIIAKWYLDEWGYLKKDSTVQSFIQDMENYLNTDKIPLMLLAVDDGKPLGVVQLKYREMSIYPDKEHWLGGVYVAKEHRGRNIAEQMVQKLIQVSRSLGVETLHLQTERLDGGLYRRLGWQAVEQVNYRGIDVLVMQKNIVE